MTATRHARGCAAEGAGKDSEHTRRSACRRRPSRRRPDRRGQRASRSSRDIHPAILTEGGLSPALRALGRRSEVRVKLDVGFEHRLSDQVKVAGYHTVSEALTNGSKHANAARVWVSLRGEDDMLLLLSVRDQGAGGAAATRGSD